MKSSTARFSARNWESMPSSTKAASSRWSRKVLRSVLRRWPNAALTIWAYSFSFYTAISAAGKGIMRTMAEFTLGAGRNDSGGTSSNFSM